MDPRVYFSNTILYIHENNIIKILATSLADIPYRPDAM